MARSVNKVASRNRRRKMLKLAKGYFGRKKNVWTVAKNQIEKGLVYAYRDRKTKKRNFRQLWIARINAAARIHGYSYSNLIGMLKTAGVDLNRKVLADIAMNHPEAFGSIVEFAKSGKITPRPESTSPAQKVRRASKPVVAKVKAVAATEAPLVKEKTGKVPSKPAAKAKPAAKPKAKKETAAKKTARQPAAKPKAKSAASDSKKKEATKKKPVAKPKKVKA